MRVEGGDYFERREKTHLTAQLDKSCAHLSNRGALVLAQVGNRLMVGHPPQQPHHFEVAARFLLQPPGDRTAVVSSVDPSEAVNLRLP
jgi:hypothetical protein